MIIGAKEPDQQDTGSSYYAGIRRLSHKICCVLDTGSLADTTHYRPCHHCYYRNLSHLETQA